MLSSVKARVVSRGNLALHRPLTTMTQDQTIYIVTAIHCPSIDGMNPNCYTITGAYNTPSAAQAAMKAKAKELFNKPVTHSHGSIHKGEMEWKEGPFKIEFKGHEGDVGLCWVDERQLGVEDIPITPQTFKHGMAGETDGEEWVADSEVEKTLCSLLKF